MYFLSTQLAQGLMIGNFFMLDTYTPDVFSTDVRNVTFSLLDGFSKVQKLKHASNIKEKYTYKTSVLHIF